MDRSVLISKAKDERKDRIFNELPCCVKSYILSFLTIKDAVDICMISHQWRHVWNISILTRANLEFDIPNVFGGKYSHLVKDVRLEEDFDLQYSLRQQFERKFFVKFVNEFLLLYRGKKIHSFKVAFFLDKQYTDVLDKWVHFAIEKGAEVLDLKLLPGVRYFNAANYVFPHWLLSELKASTLKHLSLQKCVLKPPPDFDKFIQLKTLYLDKAIVDPFFLAHLFSVCLQLESLTLARCSLGSSNLIIGPSLHLKDLKLKVIDFYSLDRMRIDAVNLSSFEYIGAQLQIHWMRIPRLVRYFYSAGGKVELFPLLYSLPYELIRLASFPELETLHLEFLINQDILGIPQTIPTYRNLKQLNLVSFIDYFDIWSILNLLKAAPLLEELEVQVHQSRYIREARNLPGFSHDHLRVFKLQGYQGTQIEIQFAICILRIATKLEELVIDPLGKHYIGAGMWTKPKRYCDGNENEVRERLEGVVTAAQVKLLHFKTETRTFNKKKKVKKTSLK